MALPNGAGGYQFGDGNVNEPLMGYMPAPATATVTATLTPTQVTAGILLGSPGSTAPARWGTGSRRSRMPRRSIFPRRSS